MDKVAHTEMYLEALELLEKDAEQENEALEQGYAAALEKLAGRKLKESLKGKDMKTQILGRAGVAGGALAGAGAGGLLGELAGDHGFRAYHKLKGTKVDKPFTAYRKGFKGTRGISAFEHGFSHFSTRAQGGLLGIIAGALAGATLAHNGIFKNKKD
jgi:hypothetical protein